MIKKKHQTHEEVHEQLLTYKRAKDMLEDFVCGPNIDTHIDKFYEYVKDRDEIRELNETHDRESFKNADSPYTRCVSAMNKIGGYGNDPDIAINYGPNASEYNFKRFKNEDPYAKQDTEVEMDSMRVVYTYAELNPTFLKWADLWLDIAYMFPVLVTPDDPNHKYAKLSLQYWYSHRTRIGDTDYTKYFHMALGSVAGLSNALFSVCCRTGVKIYVVEWAPLPPEVPICTKEYTDDTYSTTWTIPQHWGFKCIYYDLINDCFSDTAHCRYDEEFPKLDLRNILRVPDPTVDPEAPGPDPRSPYGLSIALYDPTKQDVPEFPYIFEGHGMTLEMDKPYFEGGMSLWGIQCLDGLSINDETGGLQVNTTDGIELYPLVVSQSNPSEILSVGGLGVEASLTENLDKCNEYLENAEMIMDIVKVLQIISELFPCL